MSDTDFSEISITPNDDGSEHGIDSAFELGGPVSRGLSDRVESTFQVEDRVETGLLAGLQPGLADEHGSPPSVFEGEAGEDADEALVSQIGPVVTQFRLGSSFFVIHFRGGGKFCVLLDGGIIYCYLGLGRLLD